MNKNRIWIFMICAGYTAQVFSASTDRIVLPEKAVPLAHRGSICWANPQEAGSMLVPEKVKKKFRTFVIENSFPYENNPRYESACAFERIYYFPRKDGVEIFFLQGGYTDPRVMGDIPFPIVAYDPKNDRCSRVFDTETRYFSDCYWEDLKGDGEEELAVDCEDQNGSAQNQLKIYFYIPQKILSVKKVLTLSEASDRIVRKNEIIKKEKGYIYVRESVWDDLSPDGIKERASVTKYKLDFNQFLNLNADDE